MAAVQLTCVVKPHPDSPHEHITHVGTSHQTWLREQVISWIDGGIDSFYTVVQGKRAEVGIVRDAGNAPYLRTRAGGHWNDDLLALPQCR